MSTSARPRAQGVARTNGRNSNMLIEKADPEAPGLAGSKIEGLMLPEPLGAKLTGEGGHFLLVIIGLHGEAAKGAIFSHRIGVWRISHLMEDMLALGRVFRIQPPPARILPRLPGADHPLRQSHKWFRSGTDFSHQSLRSETDHQ